MISVFFLVARTVVLMPSVMGKFHQCLSCCYISLKIFNTFMSALMIYNKLVGWRCLVYVIAKSTMQNIIVHHDSSVQYSYIFKLVIMPINIDLIH